MSLSFAFRSVSLYYHYRYSLRFAALQAGFGSVDALWQGYSGCLKVYKVFEKQKRVPLLRACTLFFSYCLKGLFTKLSLLCKQFLKFAVQGLAHCTVSHCLITFDTVLQHHNFIYVFFHNRLDFVLPAFRKAVVHLFLFSFLITLQRYELFSKNMFYNIKILYFLPTFTSKHLFLSLACYKKMTTFVR